MGVVYFGSAGKAIFGEGGPSIPWYGYAAIGSVFVLFAQLIAKYATNTIKEMEIEDQLEQEKLNKKE